MCFNPTISLTTAIIEFALAYVIYRKFKCSDYNNFAIILMLILGFYQFSEFMLCKNENVLLWSRMAIMTYTLLPAIAVHSGVKFLGYDKKRPYLPYLIYLPVILFLALMLKDDFILGATCNTVFVTIIDAWSDTYLFNLYAVYYLGGIIISIMLWYEKYKIEKKSKKDKYLYSTIGASLMLLATYATMFVAPKLKIMIPSVMCHFALLFALSIFLGLYLENRKLYRKKNTKKITWHEKKI